MENIWYICKYCNRALTSSHLLKVHKLNYHAPELRQLKRTRLKLAAEAETAQLLLNTKSRLKADAETIRKEDSDGEETEPRQPSTIKDEKRAGRENSTSESGFKTCPARVNPPSTDSSTPGRDVTPGEQNTTSDAVRRIKVEYEYPGEDGGAGEVVAYDEQWTIKDTRRGVDAEDSSTGRSGPLQRSGHSSSSNEEVRTISQHFYIISGSEPDSISVGVEGRGQREPVQTVTNSERPNQQEVRSLYQLGLFRRYQLDEHFYQYDQTLTFNCCYCSSGIGYKYFKRALNHVLTHTSILREKNCLEKLRQCAHEYYSFTQIRHSSLSRRNRVLHSSRKAITSRSLVCPYCGKRFSLQAGLQFHMRHQHHNRTTPDSLTLKSTTDTQLMSSIPRVQGSTIVPEMENAKKKQARAAGFVVPAYQPRDHGLMPVHVQRHTAPQHIGNINHASVPVGVTGEIYTCPKCLEKFKRKLHLTTHLKLHRKNPGQYRCRDCSASFETVTKRSRHRRREHSLKCKICDKICSNVHILQRHTLEVHTNSIHKCEFCGKMFPTNWGLSYHLKMHLRKEVTLQRAAQRLVSFSCTSPGCFASFDKESKLKQHLRSSHTSSNGASALESFTSSIFTNIEVQATLGNNSNVEGDDGRLGSQSQEITHAQTRWKKAVLGREELQPYPNPNPYEELTINYHHRCCDCNQSFKDTVELEIHTQSHTRVAIQLAYCTFCGQMISNALGLEAHMEMHRKGILQCACHQCHQVYSSISKFNHHMLTTHERQDA